MPIRQTIVDGLYLLCGINVAPPRISDSHLQTTTHKLSLSLKESLPPGSSEAWSSLNRLRTGTGQCKALIQKWGYNEDGQAACECGDELTMKHLLVCPIEDGQAACECGDELTMKHLLVCPIEDGQAAYECGDELTMKHLLVCPILPHPCSHEDLEEFNPQAYLI